MPLINCKIEISLKWIENCMLTTATTATFKITDAKLYVPIVTLSSEDNVKLSNLLSEGFERPNYWNENKVIPNKIVNIDSSYQGVKRLFVLAHNNTSKDNSKVSIHSFKKYFLPRVKIENCNIKINGRNFYNQPIHDSNNRYDEMRKNINRTRWWLNYRLFIRFCLFWKKLEIHCSWFK